MVHGQHLARKRVLSLSFSADGFSQSSSTTFMTNQEFFEFLVDTVREGKGTAPVSCRLFVDGTWITVLVPPQSREGWLQCHVTEATCRRVIYVSPERISAIDPVYS